MAILIDMLIRRARRKRWSQGKLTLILALTALLSGALPVVSIAIAPQQSIKGTLTYEVSSIPDPSGVPATPVRASLSPDSNVHNGVQGAAEITVQGQWALDIVVTGSAGPGEASVPIIATAPPAIPTWLGWVIGFIPLYALFVFLLSQRGRKARQAQAAGVE